MGSIAIRGMPTAVAEWRRERYAAANPPEHPASDAISMGDFVATLDIVAATVYNHAPDGIPMRQAMPRLCGEPP
jgi:hypothetical protein